jgi:hypothetical protein
VRFFASFVAMVVLALVGVASTGSAAMAADDPTISVGSGQATPEVGNIVVVHVRAQNLVDLAAYSLEFTFDPALIEFVSATDPTAIDGFGEATLQPDAASVRYVHTVLGTSPSTNGDVELVAMRFRALVAGATTITLGTAELVDSAGTTTTQTDVGVYGISISDPAATTGGLTAAAPGAAAPGGTGSADTGSAGASSSANGGMSGDARDLAGTGVEPLAAALLAGELMLLGAALLVVRRNALRGLRDRGSSRRRGS